MIFEFEMRMMRELLCMVIGLLCGSVTLSAQKQVKGEVRADVVRL